MIRKFSHKKISILTIIFSLFIFSQHLKAEISLVVNPQTGGSELDFGQLNQLYQEVSRQVDIEMKDTTAQYELRQEPLGPLRSAKGDEIPWHELTVRGLSGTNKFGRLNVNPETIVNSVLYTANQNGSPDSFSLVYTIKTASGIRPDYYRGQLKFTVLPVNASQNSVSTILNVIVVVKLETETGRPQASLEIGTTSGSGFIYLSSAKEENKRCDVSVKINGSFKKLFSIKQILALAPESNEGNRLGPGTLNVQVEATQLGIGLPLSTLSLSPQAVYTSRPTGEADSSFIISYTLADLSGQKAGRYRSRIQFILEEMGLEIEKYAMGLEVEIERFFDLVVTSQFGGGLIEFSGLKPGEPPKINEVIVEIRNNTGKRYQVNQNVLSELVNKQGNKIASEYFTFRTESRETKGVLKAAEKQEVKKTDAVVFISDASGSSDAFKIIYELAGSWDIKAGDYATRISYTLLEI